MAVTYTAGSVMDTAAALLNDAPKTQYTYTVQLPYLKMANQELEQQLNLHEVPLNLISEYESVVLAGVLHLSLPTSFFLPIQLFERASGATLDSDYRLMSEVSDVFALNYDQTDTLVYWDYRHNCINFIGATANREVRLRYWRQLTAIVDDGSLESQAGANNFLALKTAEYCAKYVMRDIDRAISLKNDAQDAIDLLCALLVKNNQNLRVRRQPFNRPGIDYSGWGIIG